MVSLSLHCCRRIDRSPRSSPSSSVPAIMDLYAILELVTILTLAPTKYYIWREHLTQTTTTIIYKHILQNNPQEIYNWLLRFFFCFLFSILLHYYDVCNRGRDDALCLELYALSKESQFFDSCPYHTVPCIACGRSDTITTRTMVT